MSKLADDHSQTRLMYKNYSCNHSLYLIYEDDAVLLRNALLTYASAIKETYRDSYANADWCELEDTKRLIKILSKDIKLSEKKYEEEYK
jgi:hypothetical protein